MSVISRLLALLSRPRRPRASAEDLAAPGLRRYPGPRSFEDKPEDAALFCGRSAEVAALAARIRATRLLVLFGRSGSGKTSLLQAGAAPELRRHLLLPVRVLIRDGSEPLTALVAREIARSCATHGFIHRPGESERLWDWLAGAVIRSRDRLITPVLVFDQFEEMFTLLPPERRNGIAAQIGAVAAGLAPSSAASDEPPRVKIVISLREDFVGALEELAGRIPGLFQERFQLAPLSRAQARVAIVEPAARPQPEAADTASARFATNAFRFDDEVLDEALDYLTGASGYVEPFQLQILCRHVENSVVLAAARRGATLTVIGRRELAGRAALDAVMSGYYQEQIALLPLRLRARAREMCEEGLLTAKGFRLSLQESQIAQDYRLDVAALELLLKGRLLRREHRLENYFYELSHDSLAGPILAGRPRWRVPRKLRPVVDAAAVGILIGIVALGYYGHQARHERDSADNMIAFLIGDNFVEQVLRTGRIDILERVQDEAKRYYLQRQSRATPDSRRNLALVARNAGYLDVVHGDSAAARRHLDEARAGLQSLIDDGEDPGENSVELAITLGRLGELARNQGDLGEAIGHYLAAERLLAGLVQTTATGEAKREAEYRGRLAEAWNNLAEAYADQGHNEQALALIERSVPALKAADAAQSWQNRWSRLLVNAWLTKAAVLELQGQRDAARELFAATDRYVTALRLKDPLNAEAIYQAAVVLNWIVVRRVGTPDDPAAAQRYLRDLLARSEAVLADLNKVIEAYPARPARRHDVAVLNSAAADLALEIDPDASVLARYALAEKTLIALTDTAINAEADPKHAFWRMDLAIVRHQYARALKNRGQLQEAARLRAESRAAFEALARDDPSNATLRAWLAQF